MAFTAVSWLAPLVLLIHAVALSSANVEQNINVPRKMLDGLDGISSMVFGRSFSAQPMEITKARGTSRPLIGILAQPVAGETPTGDQKHPYSNYSSYIAASYVKFVEAAGARAVPIMYNMPHAEMARRFKAVNGLLLPGGGQNICDGPYAEAGKFLLERAKLANEEGDYFPVWGTCLGFEQLLIAFSNNCSINTKGWDSEDDASPLILTEEGETSRMLGGGGKNAMRMQQLATSAQGLAMENHGQGVGLEDWRQNARLSSLFKAVSYSRDRNGRKYVSTIEGRDLPIYGTQWHPEKNLFEWTLKENVPHSADASLLTQGLANFLVEEARKSTHAPASYEEELDLLIYNYVPTFTAKTWPEFNFDQCYFFE